MSTTTTFNLGENFPEKNIKKITYRANGTVESIEYFEEKKTSAHCSCCSRGYYRDPWQYTTVTSKPQSTWTINTTGTWPGEDI